jgi:hypothetical protein
MIFLRCYKKFKERFKKIKKKIELNQIAYKWKIHLGIGEVLVIIIVYHIEYK